ncbi:hypothetical protein PL11_005390 [Lentilactobacillus curieae]|uniref:Lipoprotein n=1 Tax=Lentilactobacillus curieae TaxID=1138822 RepID=A0A1S6QIG3_9LACO|nr:hypothetical protein [Lentilactobacillus curieae]AQW21404.1 hypothetical protein PL11_005390 [Lentilactobacillus curieae]
MKRKVLMIAVVFLGIILAGCGKANLSVNDKHVDPDGLAAVIKGQSNQKTVNYQIDGAATKSVKTKSGAFAFTVPAKDKVQTVTIKTGKLSKDVRVSKIPALGNYSTISSKYNQSLAGSALSKQDQKLAGELSAKGAALKKEQAKLKQASPQVQATKGQALMKQAASLKADSAKVKKALAVANSKVKDTKLPTKAKNGVSDLIKTKHMTIRGNVSDGKTIGLALMVPVKDLKTVKKAKSFVTSFSILADSVGADAKKILSDFQKQANGKNKNQTTTNVLKSHGVNFSIGYSTTTLYVYITK